MSKSDDLKLPQQTPPYVGIAGDSLGRGIAFALANIAEIRIRSAATDGSGLVQLEKSIALLLQESVTALIISCGTNDWNWPMLDWVSYQAGLQNLMRTIPPNIKTCFWLPPESADGYIKNLPGVRNAIEGALAGFFAVKTLHWPADPEPPTDHVHPSPTAYRQAGLISLAILKENLGNVSDLQY